MRYESCYEKYRSYFSKELVEAFAENGLTFQHILEYADDQCEDRSCHHHLFWTYEGNRKYGTHGSLPVNPSKQQDVPFVKQCHGCMCLLGLITDLPSPEDIANAFGINRQGVRWHLNNALKKVRSELQINP